MADTAVKGKRLLLVDDVTTTGATLLAAAGALKRAGAEVYTVTFAATLRRDMDLYGAEGEGTPTREREIKGSGDPEIKEMRPLEP